MLDEKQLALLIAPAACRVLAKRLPDGRIAIAAASDIGASKGLPKEVGIAMGELVFVLILVVIVVVFISKKKKISCGRIDVDNTFC